MLAHAEGGHVSRGELEQLVELSAHRALALKVVAKGVELVEIGVRKGGGGQCQVGLVHVERVAHGVDLVGERVLIALDSLVRLQRLDVRVQSTDKRGEPLAFAAQRFHKRAQLVGKLRPKARWRRRRR